MSKPKLHLLGDCADAKKLARMYEQITGKRPSAVEIQTMQKKIDAAREAKRLRAAK